MPCPPDPVLRAAHVFVRRAGARREAVHDVSLALAAGKTLALLGPSGSGKSTLALALLGAVPHLVPGELSGEIARPDRLREGIAAVLQDTDAQLVALTVEDEIAFGLENRSFSPRDIEARIDEALARPPGHGLARRHRTLELSGGWRQRLAIAAALAEKARLLVLDEPFAHLPVDAADDAGTTIAAAARHGAATILVEHRAEQAARLADHVLVLDRHGHAVIAGPTGPALYEAARGEAALGLRLPAAVRVAVALQKEWLLPDSCRPLDGDALLHALGTAASEPRVLPAALGALGLDRLRPAVAAGKPLVTIESASLRRSRRLVLDRIDLAVGEGEVVGIVGPNGAGKTSLALLACGALRPSAGRVRRSPQHAAIYLPQNPSLAFATGRLEHEAQRRRLSWPAARAAIDAAGLPADPKRHPLAFSHGERRRLALALAFAHPAPSLMVLDEPGSGLDQASLDELAFALERLRGKGCGTMVVAHDIDWLAGVCDRVLVVEAARIVANDTPAAFLAGLLERASPLQAPDAVVLAGRLGWTPGIGSHARAH